MLKDVVWADDGTYRPGERFSPIRFFSDGLKNSCEFDLQLGYFSSAAISVLSEGFATFISKGGNMRLAINHIVSPKDKEAIVNASLSDGIFDCIDLSDFDRLQKTFDEYQEQFFRCLSYLISKKRIEIRIVKPKGKQGIAHTKSGQFRDGESTISFTGSANFTISGLFNNIEEIKIDKSDSPDEMAKNRIVSQKKSFDEIMDGDCQIVEYLSPDKLQTTLTAHYKDVDIEELLDAEKQLAELRIKRRMESATHGDVVREDIHHYEQEPCFPYDSPREYQIHAFENWKENNQKGLFAMATGTGKTLTSLNCLLEIYKRKGYYKAVILVPTQTLVDQWYDECLKFNFANIYKVYSKNPNWKDEVERLHFKEDFNLRDKEISFIVISTYASLVRDNVFTALTTFSRNKTLLIADEAHNMGARRILERIDGIKYLRRIGLSATPNRQFDETGNKAISEFFGCTQGYTFEYPMQEAIDNGFLCRYKYYPHVVRLNDVEMAEYLKISKQLAKYFLCDNDSFVKGDDILTALLLKRKRIIHKAQNKETVFKQIIENRYKEKNNLKYTLVYVPEGNKPDESSDVFEVSDKLADDIEMSRLIDRYTRIICKVSKTTTVREFTSESKDRAKMLSDFANGTLEVLTSMKCLDEGVDVPRSEFAIFCASTGNPRQFIQRRGRILRKHKDKRFAVIHDLVVAPFVETSSDSFRMERSLLATELKRVRDFASLSENAEYAYNELENITSYYNLPIL